jgi:hypothetical protein
MGRVELLANGNNRIKGLRVGRGDRGHASFVSNVEKIPPSLGQRQSLPADYEIGRFSGRALEDPRRD